MNAAIPLENTKNRKIYAVSRKPALTGEDLQDIDQLIIAQPDITIDEIIEKQGLSVSNETVRKAVIRLGYVYKKKSFYAAERERVRCCGSERSLE